MARLLCSSLIIQASEECGFYFKNMGNPHGKSTLLGPCHHISWCPPYYSEMKCLVILHIYQLPDWYITDSKLPENPIGFQWFIISVGWLGSSSVGLTSAPSCGCSQLVSGLCWEVQAALTPLSGASLLALGCSFSAPLHMALILEEARPAASQPAGFRPAFQEDKG